MKNSRIILKRFIGNLFSGLPKRGKRKIILLYHSVGDSLLATSPSDFKYQLEWLKSYCYVTNLDSILNFNNEDNNKYNDIEVAITFDDGYKSLVKNVLPIVKEFNITPCVFINTNCIKENYSLKSNQQKGHYPNENFMNWHDIKFLHKEGWTIGSHGCNHYDLTKIGNFNISEELILSKKLIEKKLNSSCIYFSYTFGNYNEKLISQVKESGYEYSFTGVHKPLIANFNKYLIPRINIEKDYSLNDFISIIKGDWDYHSWPIVNLVKRFLR